MRPKRPRPDREERLARSVKAAEVLEMRFAHEGYFILNFSVRCSSIQNPEFMSLSLFQLKTPNLPRGEAIDGSCFFISKSDSVARNVIKH